ncbi:MAG: hypothetical protein IKY01_10590 [Prevotella sp.]|nr:hypothetical protein [Prevotella sp.]
MKKILLSAVALVAAMSVNAQVIQVDGKSFVNDTKEGAFVDEKDKLNVPIEAGVEFGSIDALTVSNAFTTNHQNVDCKNNNFTKVVIDGNEVLAANGLQGQDNPKDADGGNSALTLKPAVQGAVLKIDAKKNGWVYIVAKLSTNKQYMVFEEGLPIGYKIAMENADERIPGGVINLEIKGEGEYNNIPESVAQQNGGTGIGWVIREFLGDAEATTAGNGLGVFYFPVAEGCTYLAHATGSKISWSGIYFSETEAKSVTVEGEGISKTLVGEGSGSEEPAGPQEVTVNGLELKTYSAIGQWGGQWSEIVDLDWTPYEYVWVKYSGHSGAVKFGVTYSEWLKLESWGDVFADAGVNFEGEAGIVGIKIDNETKCVVGNAKENGQYIGEVYGKHVRQLFIQATQADSNVTLEGIWVGSKADFDAAKATGIQAVKAAQADGVIYNLAGQRVDANYKGVVIMNGQKKIQK